MQTQSRRPLRVSIVLLLFMWLVFLERAPVNQHRRGQLPPMHTGAPTTASHPPVTGDAANPASRAVLRVATYNIHRTIGADGIRSADRIGELIRPYDVVGLQEVQHALLGSPSRQTPYLARYLPGESVFVPTKRRRFLIVTGNALISRFSGTWQSRPLLPSQSGERGFLTFQARIHGAELTIIVVHITPLRPHGDRQLASILERFKSERRAILLGDFNVRHDNARLQRFLNEGEAIDALAGRVLDPPRPPWLVDWILARGLRVADAGIVHSPASDHPLVWADIALPHPSTE